MAPDAESDFSARCKFRCVRQKVVKNLTQARGISTDWAQVRLDVHHQLIAIGSNQTFGGGRHGVHQFGQVNIVDVQLDPSAVNLREIEHVVDEAQQMASSALDARQVRQRRLHRRCVRQIVFQQLRVADHRIERRTQFVAHVRQERALRTVGLFSLLAREFCRLALLLQLDRLLLNKGISRLDLAIRPNSRARLRVRLNAKHSHE